MWVHRIGRGEYLSACRSMGWRGTIASVSKDFTATTSGDERCIDATDVQTRPSGEPAEVSPLGMNNRAVGGGPWQYDPISGKGQRGVDGSFGLNNIGLLVRVWGEVTDRDTNAEPQWFILNDGANCEVKVVVPDGSTAPDIGEHTAITGISSCEKAGALLVPVVLGVADTIQ
jgi:hypothetical protein